MRGGAGGAHSREKFRPQLWLTFDLRPLCSLKTPEQTIPGAWMSNQAREKGLRPIWAIGGGKGGTGKTFLTAGLGAQLSRQGIPVNLIDADLGSPNLHTFLGVREPDPTLAEFFFEHLDLAEVLIDTDLQNLKFVVGPRRHLMMPNLEYFRKLRFLRQIRELASQRLTIVDTGAGSALNTLDLFSVAREPVLVINPNPASVENLFLFLEAAVLRILRLKLRMLGLEKAVNKAFPKKQRRKETPPELFRQAVITDSSCQTKLRSALDRFQPCLVMNRSQGETDLLLGRSLVDVARRCLELRIHFLGAIPEDPAVGGSLRQFRPFVSTHPDSDTATAILLIMDRLLERSRCSESQV